VDSDLEIDTFDDVELEAIIRAQKASRRASSNQFDPSDAWLAAVEVSRIAANAVYEIQGFDVIEKNGEKFFFLPAFGFEKPENIPARPDNYGVGEQL
jgi:hypothetical protein